MSDVRSSEIRTIDVVSDNLYQWGIEVKDYLVGSTRTDFQDLLVVVCEDRAQTIEKEVEPMASRMDVRNKRLDNLGEALAIVADIQAQFVDEESKQKAQTSTAKLTQKAYDGLRIVGWEPKSGEGVGTKISFTCSEADYWQQLLKAKIDSLNNASQDDMTRLQSLVDRRDEAYSTATSLMQNAGDTRANTIKNM